MYTVPWLAWLDGITDLIICGHTCEKWPKKFRISLHQFPCQHVFVCLYELILLTCNLSSHQIHTIQTLRCFSLWKHCFCFDSQPKLMTPFDVERHLQCSLWIKRSVRALKVYYLSSSQGQASSRGPSVPVIHQDARDWSPRGQKCNMSNQSAREKREKRLNLSTTEKEYARGFYMPLNKLNYDLT